MFNIFSKKKLIEIINKSETACITGHRPDKLPWFYDETKENCVRFKKDLKTIFEGAIKYGLKNFLTGMAEGFDMIGTEILLDLQKKHKEIKVIAIIPCKGQELKWKPEQQKRYHKILKQCDEIIVLTDTYTQTCMNDRNKYMVEHSSVVIACFNGIPSGTGNTIRFAKEKGCNVKLINPDNYQ